MAKIALSKLTTIKNIPAKTITINEQEIVVEQYLPVNDKLAIVERVLSNTIDDTGYLNPVRLEIFTNLEIIAAYTNISITEKMMENAAKTYDLLLMNNVLDQVLMAIPEDEYNMLFEAITESAEHIVNYLSSFAGMIKTANTDFSNTQINLEEMMKTLDDPEKIGFLKEILEKLG